LLANCGAFFSLNNDLVKWQGHEYYTALKNGGGVVDEVYVVAEICGKYGWTWEEYHAQPVHFIETIKEKLRIEHEVQQEQNKT